MTDVLSLKPYKSLILAEINTSHPTPGIISSILDESMDILELNPGNHPRYRREFIARPPLYTDGVVESGFIHYRVYMPPTWTMEAGIEDTLNHLFLVIRWNQRVAIYLSESQKKNTVQNRFGKDTSTGLGVLRPVSQNRLNAGYLDGETRTLWLSGTHRRTSIKADSKILTGLDLRDALDPLSDQTYYFTAARSLASIGGRKIPVGCSPRHSRIWTGVSSSWQDFEDGIVILLGKLDSVEDLAKSPLPVVASPVIPAVADVSRPFDMAFMPPALDDPTLSPVDQSEIERWGFHSKFENITPSDNGKKITADLYMNDVLLGNMEMSIDIRSDGRVRLAANGQEASPDTKEDFKTACAHAEKPEWIKIWYESGLTVSDGQFYSVRWKDIPFQNIHWVNFTGYKVGQEKPKNASTGKDDPKAIGTDHSLFDWVFDFWPNLDGTHTLSKGWLACDDGAMEIADFIHIDEAVSPPTITLIHVKGGKTSGISVSDYEVVGSQAVKNLRSLDEQELVEGLKRNIENSIKKLIWHNGVGQNDRQGMLTVLKNLGTNYRRQVIILQPSLRKTQAEAARENKTGDNYARLQQLDSLLLGIQANCRSLGADMWVLGNAA
ncbi:MAG: hypothetical protein GYA15_08280 [Leptolinea sp.]|jgi:hypothetical protein|nr:hypothetical protein [Leptolinea sp.]